MELLSLRLRISDRHARVLLAGAQRAADLEGERFARLLAAAAPLVEEIARRARVRPSAFDGVPGPPAWVRAISVDTELQVVRASLVGSPLGSGGCWGGTDWPTLAPFIEPVVQAALREVPATPSEARFWDQLYLCGDDGWELGAPAPPLARLFAANPPRARRTLVVGCGRGHEARLLASLGADVTAIDLSPVAIDAARALGGPGTVGGIGAGGAPGRLEFAVRDLFTLGGAPTRYQLVVEHTCFCAIDPSRRGEYARAMAAVIEPGGALWALFWAHGRPGGPPFGASAGELEALFARDFVFEEREVPPDSVASRAGEELLVRMRRR